MIQQFHSYVVPQEIKTKVVCMYVQTKIYTPVFIAA